jgi:hypothetical protein
MAGSSVDDARPVQAEDEEADGGDQDAEADR